jgi:hypothetical protein
MGLVELLVFFSEFGCISLVAFTMFNVFFPKLLELGPSSPEAVKTLEDNLWDVMIFTIGGTPGAIVRVPAYIYIDTTYTHSFPTKT